MKSLLPFFILLSFAGVALLGFAAMECGPHGCDGCLASLLMGTECPPGNPLATAAFHINAWQSTYTGILGDALLPAAMLLFMGYLSTLIANYASVSLSYILASQGTHALSYASLPIARRQHRWLAQHEHSPTAY